LTASNNDHKRNSQPSCFFHGQPPLEQTIAYSQKIGQSKTLSFLKQDFYLMNSSIF
jgi:hypothetical protein